ncbi:MAG: hypothetical protein QOJ10_591 [Chloroflexota bacterium]|jgi:H+/gluconate symporter-like permease|nr:hypothetical protein [Chloroflexota bacterium]
MRLSIGSATVATVTAAGIIAPLAVGPSIHAAAVAGPVGVFNG